MGHYRSEMVCNTCGNAHCSCPRKPTKEDLSYVLNEQFDIVPAKSVHIMTRLYWPLHETVEKAEAARAEAIRLNFEEADENLRRAISAHRARILELINATKRSPKVTRVGS